MEEGDLVYINYIGKIKESGEIFDTNIEEVAKKANIYNEKLSYKPLPVLIGAKFVFKKIEDTLKEMKVGEKKEIELNKEEAYGERREDLVRQFSTKDFLNQGINPIAGQEVTINGIRGRILSVSGGRVIVDFNHPLAGKNLVFEIEVVSKAKNDKEKILGIIEIFSNSKDFDVEIENESIKIKDKKKILDFTRKNSISETILKFFKNIKKVQFIDEYERES